MSMPGLHEGAARAAQRALATLGLAAAALLSPPFSATGAAAASDAAAAGGVAAGAGEPPTLAVDHACSSAESWRLGGIREGSQKEFRSFLSGGLAPVRGFAEALALRRVAQSPAGRLFAEYWISRSLLEGKLPHIAAGGFAAVASRPVSPETAGPQFAALECLLRIQEKHPATALPAGVAKRLSEYAAQARTDSERSVAWEAAASLARALLADERAQDRPLEPLLRLLQGSGAYDELTRGLKAARANEHSSAIERLERFLDLPSIPRPLKRFVDSAHLLAARSLYATGQFDRASAHLKQVSRSSNDLAASLSELAWSNLLAERYPEAIGTALNLQAGGLRHTFEPEAPMVMAMALNELCQYPESVHAIQAFRRAYEKPYAWLSKNLSDDLYPRAVEFVRRQGDVPDRVGTEWARSPLFLSSQDEINLLFDEGESASTLGRSGSIEQRKLGEAILKLAKEARPKLQIAKMKLKPGERLAQSLLDQLAELRLQITRFRRLQQAAPVWHKVLARFNGSSPGIEKRLVAAINRDLKLRSQRMLSQLEEVAENVQLIEVEIYNGASQDIIWQNAHPDYKQVAQKLGREESGASAGKVWDWGRTPSSLDESGEIWEDELGSFKANLFDNCTSKDRYLALKLGRRSRQ